MHLLLALALLSAQDDPVRTVAVTMADGAAATAAYAAANPDLARDGILDVTRAPYSADSSGQTDVTATLQQALKDARDAQMVLYLPAGTYRVSDTLECSQGQNDRSPELANVAPQSLLEEHNGALQHDDFPCVLRGQSYGGRAVIQLDDRADASGLPSLLAFRNPAQPKPVVFFWSRGRTSDPDTSQPNGAYNMRVIGVDLALGQNNTGAIGIDVQGAQGCAIEDVTVRAGTGFAGLRGLSGSGGGQGHITVTGGRYGILADIELAPYYDAPSVRGTQTVPVVSDLRLFDQSVAAILYDGFGPLVLAGAHIRGAGIVVDIAYNQAEWNGGLSIIDAIFEIEGGGPAIDTERPVLLQNVYFKGASDIVAFSGSPAVSVDASEWHHVDAHAVTPDPVYSIWIDGVQQSATEWLSSTSTALPPPPGWLASRHGWPEPFGWGDHPAALNARDFGVLGDGATDDTLALQAVLDAAEARFASDGTLALVFLPKGVYPLSVPLVLGPHTRLIGVSSTDAVLTPSRTAPAFGDPSQPRPLIETDDRAAGESALGFVKLWPRRAGTAAIHWRTGARSVVRNAWLKMFPGATFGAAVGYPMVLIEGDGGGRWYNVFVHQDPNNQQPSYRQVLVQGTSEPLAFYMLDAEHADGTYQMELSGAANVSIYALKAETYGPWDSVLSPPLRLDDCHDVQIHGQGGIAEAHTGEVLFPIDASQDFRLSNYGHFRDPDLATWTLLADGAATVPATQRPVLYQRGTPAPAVIDMQRPPRPDSLLIPPAPLPVTIDGTMEASWSDAALFHPDVLIGGTRRDSDDLSAEARALWDGASLVLMVTVTDDTAVLETDTAWQDDAIEVYVDANHDRPASYGADDFHFVFRRGDATAYELKHDATAGVAFAWQETASGFVLEAALPFSLLGQSVLDGGSLGFDLHLIDDDDGGDRDALFAWADRDNLAWSNPQQLGTAILEARAASDGGPTADGAVADGGATDAGPTSDSDISGDGTVTTGDERIPGDPSVPAVIARSGCGCSGAASGAWLLVALVALLCRRT